LRLGVRRDRHGRGWRESRERPTGDGRIPVWKERTRKGSCPSDCADLQPARDAMVATRRRSGCLSLTVSVKSQGVFFFFHRPRG
jgi:hypothetical protein